MKYFLYEPLFSSKDVSYRRCGHEKVFPKRPHFARNGQKRRVLRLKNGGFSRFLFTDKYTWVVDEDVYYLSLA